MSLLLALGVLSYLVLSDATQVLAQPSESQVQTALSHHMPDGLKIKSIRYKNFSGTSPGTGRTSVAGIALVQKDQVRHISFSMSELYAALPELSATDIKSAARKVKCALYYKTFAKGQKIEFRAELSFRENVDGFRFYLQNFRSDYRAGQDISRARSKVAILGTQDGNECLSRIKQSAMAPASFNNMKLGAFRPFVLRPGYQTKSLTVRSAFGHWCYRWNVLQGPKHALKILVPTIRAGWVEWNGRDGMYELKFALPQSASGSIKLQVVRQRCRS